MCKYYICMNISYSLYIVNSYGITITLININIPFLVQKD